MTRLHPHAMALIEALAGNDAEGGTAFCAISREVLIEIANQLHELRALLPGAVATSNLEPTP